MRYWLIVFAFVILLGCGENEGELFSTPKSSETGISFTNTLKETDDLNILDYLYFYNGGGVAVGDIDNDGLVDIFFSGNQVKNKLYRNLGNFKFEDISIKSGVEGNSTWNTGAIMGDVNGDGLLDIYVCAVVGINGFNGFNELYINNGDSTFTESAAKYGVDFDSYSSSAAFFDYDLDGDLDLYILNHAVHTQESFGKVDLRFDRNYQTGDKLMRNDGDTFTDVSELAGIYGGINGYGLGLAISDFNQDGYPDIYVGNDFHEDDYYYLNNGDGTFTESLKEHFGHISRFSMGNDVADINHDGYPDIISLDMLPEDEIALKSSEGDDNIQIQKLRIERYGYHYQFTRNMLFLNNPDGDFVETALMSGIAATDWSWSALFSDYNQDGEQDLFISNGILRRPNDLDFVNFVSNEQIRKKLNNTKLVDQKAINMMPSGAVHNYIFKGKDNLTFENKSKQWISKDTLASGATALGDFDNDGDLDLVTNNINNTPTLYQNKTNEKASYLKIKFNYSGKNPFGIGTKVFSYHKKTMQYKELYTTRGFQSSSEPLIHFGYGNETLIDSIKIVWPNKTYQILKQIKTNQTLTVSPEKTRPYKNSFIKSKNTKKLFKKVEGNLGINFVHKEDRYTDFNREKLIPYQVSDRGPATALGDIDNDGKEDIFFGGSKFISSKIYTQKDSSYALIKIPEIQNDSVKEEVAAAILDFNNDTKNDLFIGTGGADFYGKSKSLLDLYYVKKDSIFQKESLPSYFENASVIAPYDYDNDGDTDLFIGSSTVSSRFGDQPTSFLLENKEGSFSIVKNTAISNLGMVTNAIWDDFDADGIKDLIVVGEWMTPVFLKNTSGELSKFKSIPTNLNGLWQTVIAFDVDADGDKDYLLGNWGLNSKFKASEKEPMKMYFADFDENGSTETVVTTKKENKYYPIMGLDELSSQMVSLRKKYNSYKDFAGETVNEIFSKKVLDKSKVLNVYELRSGYLNNEGGNYTFVPFKNELQVAPILDFLAYDFDADGKAEVLAAGNYFGVKPYHGRFDSFSGALIKDKNTIISASTLGLDLAQKSVRHLNIISLNKKKYLLITLHNLPVQVYQLNN